MCGLLVLCCDVMRACVVRACVCVCVCVCRLCVLNQLESWLKKELPWRSDVNIWSGPGDSTVRMNSHEQNPILSRRGQSCVLAFPKSHPSRDETASSGGEDALFTRIFPSVFQKRKAVRLFCFPETRTSGDASWRLFTHL